MTFTLNPLIDEQLGKMPMLETACMEAAQAIAEAAKEDAPVVTGDYRDGIVVQAYKGGARVWASDQKSAWVEFGNQHQPAQFILRNAAARLGFKFVPRHHG